MTILPGHTKQASNIEEPLHQLVERERQALLIRDIGIALTRSGDPKAKLQRCAEIITEHLDAAFARIWTLNEAAQTLELQASAGMYTHLDGPHGRVPVGKFKIGLIAEEREPHLTNQVLGDPRVGDQEWARREGMVSFAGYPLIVEDRLVGVIAMFARQPLSDATLISLASVADGVALGIDQARTEEALRRRERELTDFIENASVGLHWVGADGKILWANQAELDMLGYTAEEYIGRHISEFYADPDEINDILHRLNSKETLYNQEARLVAKDGAFRHVLISSNVWFEDGEFVHTRCFTRDITQRKQAEDALRKSEERLAKLLSEREQMLEEVSTPVVPVWKGILVLPIVGALDSTRMQRTTETALSEVTRTGARACIIDITGARIIDSRAVANLSMLVGALKLIGAEAIVTGINAQAAQSLVGLGLDLDAMRTHRTLAEALSSLVSLDRVTR